MRARLNSIAWCVVPFLALALTSTDVMASSVTPVSLAKKVAKSDFIFRGIVKSESVAYTESNSPWTTYTFEKVQPIAGFTDGSDFSLRCAGGLNRDGKTGEAFLGMPEFRPGQDVIVFFIESASLCQVYSWEHGTLEIVKSPTGEDVVVDVAGRPVVSLDDGGLRLGKRPAWLAGPEGSSKRFTSVMDKEVLGALPPEDERKPLSASTVIDRLKDFVAKQGKNFGAVPHRRAPVGQDLVLKLVPATTSEKP